MTLETLSIPNTGPGYITKYTLPPIPRLPPSRIYTAKITRKLNVGPGPANPRLHSQTHIDLILTSQAFHSNFKPSNPSIDSNNSTSDHRPVSTTIAIPNNPLNIYHIPQSTIHYRPLNKNEKSHLTSILQPLDTWVSDYNSTLSNLSLNDMVPITDFIFSLLVTAYKRVTLQAHAHKPTGIEEKFNEQALTSLYLLSVVPHNIQNFIYNLCSTLITTNIPSHWLKAKIFLLYKKGDPHLPTNYRPIALFNSIFKILASYGASTLTYYSTTYKLTNNTQYGDLLNHRTTDHIFSMIANLSLRPDIYHIYLDLNKAFNSVPHNALCRILCSYNIPTYLINLIKNLYAAPYDYPIVNGFALLAAHCIRGLRQGCFMSPILSTSLSIPSFSTFKLFPPHKNFTPYSSSLMTSCSKLNHPTPSTKSFTSCSPKGPYTASLSTPPNPNFTHSSTLPT